MESRTRRPVLKLLAGLLLGLTVGAAGAVLVAVIASFAFDISQQEGAYAMAVAFFYVPLGALVGAISGMVIAARRPPSEPTRHRDVQG